MNRGKRGTVFCPICGASRVRQITEALECGYGICRPCSARQYCQRESWQKAHRGVKLRLTAEQRKRRSELARLQVLSQGGVPNARKFTKGSTSGEKNCRWRGGVSESNLKLRLSKASRQWSLSVLERDNFTCQICFRRGGNLHAHHIKPFSEFPELRFDVCNGVAACNDCHIQIIHRGNSHVKPISREEIEWFKTAPVSIDWDKAA